MKQDDDFVSEESGRMTVNSFRESRFTNSRSAHMLIRSRHIIGPFVGVSCMYIDSRWSTYEGYDTPDTLRMISYLLQTFSRS